MKTLQTKINVGIKSGIPMTNISDHLANFTLTD